MMSLRGTRFVVASLIFTSLILNAYASHLDQPFIDLASLPQPEDYIFYLKFESNTDYKIWAINPDELTPRFVTSEFTFRDRSPSNTFWLLTGNRSMYIVKADGSELRPIYADNTKYKGIDPFWLTNEIILFNAYEDPYFLPPDLFRLDINTGKVTQLFSDGSKFIQAVFHNEGTWLLASWPTGPLDLVDQSGKTEKFFHDFSLVTDPHTSYHKIQRVDRLEKYLFIAKAPGEDDYKLWMASKGGTPEVFFDPRNERIDQFTISPDEKYLALTYNTASLGGTYLYVFSIDTPELLYKWVYPYTLSRADFHWSPDSRSIVLHYSESDVGSYNTVNSGIQVMDVTTGETKVIVNEDITDIIDWHVIGK
jgi:hypothetical protein